MGIEYIRQKEIFSASHLSLGNPTPEQLLKTLWQAPPPCQAHALLHPLLLPLKISLFTLQLVTLLSLLPWTCVYKTVAIFQVTGPEMRVSHS